MAVGAPPPKAGAWGFRKGLPHLVAYLAPTVGLWDSPALPPGGGSKYCPPSPPPAHHLCGPTAHSLPLGPLRAGVGPVSGAGGLMLFCVPAATALPQARGAVNVIDVYILHTP